MDWLRACVAPAMLRAPSGDRNLEAQQIEIGGFLQQLACLLPIVGVEARFVGRHAASCTRACLDTLIGAPV